MAKLYGKLSSNTRKTSVTACDSRTMTAEVNTCNYGIKVNLTINTDGSLTVIIDHTGGSNDSNRRVNLLSFDVARSTIDGE